MSVVIDMEMPKNCLECKLADRYHHDECPIYAICKSDYVDKRFEKCPIKAELPAKHGRLIDESVVLEMIRKAMCIKDLSFLYNAEKSVVNQIYHAPTVIDYKFHPLRYAVVHVSKFYWTDRCYGGTDYEFQSATEAIEAWNRRTSDVD